MNKVLCLLLISVLFVSCAKHTPPAEIKTHYITEYVNVAVPVPCNISKRNRPEIKPNSSIAATLNDLLLYVELLEADLAYCRGLAND